MANMCFSKARWLLVYMLVDFRLKADDDFPWATLEKILHELCPSNDICGRTMGWNGSFLFSERYDTCCTGCSCNENCEETNDCCFPHFLTENRQKAQQQIGKCMHPRSKYRYKVLSKRDISYPVYIVDSPPAKGCVTKDGPGCQGDDVLRFLPVSSTTTGTIYFNNECAICHGEYDTTPWIAVFICEYYKESVDALIQYVNNPNESPCFFSFFQNPTADKPLKNNDCRIRANISHSSMENEATFLKSNFNVFPEEMKDLCFSNLSLPYFSTTRKLLYDNPFCYIYDGGIGDLCMPLAREAPTRVRHAALLDYNTVTRLIEQGTGRQNGGTEHVCFKHEGKALIQDGIPPRCRPLHCPMSHFLDENGECVLFTGQVLYSGLTKNLSIQLRLITTDKKAFQDEDLDNITITDIENAMPWSITWWVIFVGYGYNGLYDGTEEQGRHELLVCLHAYVENMYTAIDEIKRILAQPVVLIINGHHIVYSQHIYRQTLPGIRDPFSTDGFRVPANKNYTTELVRWLLHVQNPDARNFDLVCWKKLHVTPEFLDTAIMLKRLHFCQQIELTPNEFTLVANGKVLVHAITGKYFYDNEFQLIGTDKGTSAKVCFEDAGFERLAQGCDCLYDSYYVGLGLTINLVMRFVL